MTTIPVLSVVATYILFLAIFGPLFIWLDARPEHPNRTPAVIVAIVVFLTLHVSLRIVFPYIPDRAAMGEWMALAVILVSSAVNWLCLRWHASTDEIPPDLHLTTVERIMSGE